jgi:hypothetical protein
MLPNTIAISILMGSLATSSVTHDLSNPGDDYFTVLESKTPQVEISSDWRGVSDNSSEIHWLRMTPDGPEHYGYLNSDRRKDDLHRLFENHLSFGEVKKAREVLAIAVKKFPSEKRFSLANTIIAPPKFISSKESKPGGTRETIQFIKNIGNGFEKKWIAVSKGELLSVSESYKELADLYKGADVFVVQVL